MKNILYEKIEEQIIVYEHRILSAIPHMHKQIEIVYVEEGYAHAFSGKKSHKIEKGYVFIAFPNQVHYYENSTKGKYHLIISPIDMFLSEKKFFYENEPKNNVIKDDDGSILKMIKNIYSLNGECRGIEKTNLTIQVISAISKKLELIPRIKGEGYTLPRILSYCKENYFKDITLDSVADELDLSKYHISHLLNQRLGIGFSSYINHLRIDMACAMLRDTEKSISEIAFEAGFGSVRSFNRAFQDIMDTTPVKYKASLVTATEGEGKIQSKDY